MGRTIPFDSEIKQSRTETNKLRGIWAENYLEIQQWMTALKPAEPSEKLQFLQQNLILIQQLSRLVSATLLKINASLLGHENQSYLLFWQNEILFPAHYEQFYRVQIGEAWVLADSPLKSNALIPTPATQDLINEQTLLLNASSKGVSLGGVYGVYGYLLAAAASDFISNPNLKQKEANIKIFGLPRKEVQIGMGESFDKFKNWWIQVGKIP